MPEGLPDTHGVYTWGAAQLISDESYKISAMLEGLPDTHGVYTWGAPAAGGSRGYGCEGIRTAAELPAATPPPPRGGRW